MTESYKLNILKIEVSIKLQLVFCASCVTLVSEMLTSELRNNIKAESEFERKQQKN